MNEAKSFIEYATNRLQYVNTDMWNDLRKFTEFYLQPFQPSLIELLCLGKNSNIDTTITNKLYLYYYQTKKHYGIYQISRVY